MLGWLGGWASIDYSLESVVVGKDKKISTDIDTLTNDGECSLYICIAAKTRTAKFRQYLPSSLSLQHTSFPRTNKLTQLHIDEALFRAKRAASGIL